MKKYADMRLPWLAFVPFLLVGLFSSAQAPSQQQSYSTVCETDYGICSVGSQPIGSYCSCSGPSGYDPGTIVYPPYNWNNMCGTFSGVCKVSFAPIGSSCDCGYEGGQIIQR